MKLLLIEDDTNLTLALLRALGPHYQIESTQTGKYGVRKAVSDNYSAIILDLHLPDMRGLQVCEQIRSNGIQTPILILTGESAVHSKVTLLDSGADDYLTKPFDVDELRARLRAIIRARANARINPSRLALDDLVIDSVRHSVERDGKDIRLTRKEFRILECLMVNAGNVVSRQQLADYAWNNEWTGGTNTIDVHIKYLRDKIDRPFTVPLIRTVRGLGYKIDASKVAAIVVN